MAEKFVRMVKDGEKPIEIHPSCVADHESLGWRRADAEAEEPQAAESKAEKKAAGKKAAE